MRFWGHLALTAVLGGFARGQVVSYEGNSFPEIEDASWERISFCMPTRTIEAGVLVQEVEVDCGGPPGGDQDGYRKSISGFEGPDFFIEFRLETDGDASEFVGQAPFALAAGSFGPVRYNWTIARDQAKLLRDVLLPILFVNIEPGVPHTYRLELRGAKFYTWFIDRTAIDSGIPEAAYPSFTPRITWLASAWNLSSVSRLDYLRFGRIAVPGSGDLDSSGTVDLSDFYFFHECVAGSGPGVDAGPGCRWADMDQDDDVDFHDFGLFQLAFTAGD
ncbi:MAG: hypothetical protein V3W34_15620 [Phycisphaerae bacterium]